MQSLGTRQKQRKEKREKEKQAGAELCQAQVQLRQAARWSKFTWLTFILGFMPICF